LTILSLSAATISSAGVLVLQASRSIDGDIGQLLKAWALSYLIFCAVLLPHSIGRLLVLQRARNATRRPER
jgi:hypothetical protein